ncbi:pentapeptide repeat-containing protein [Kordiimonas sp. SCSIO 12603]|uniref:pentapeptide repeat-containing protein n=1 Tax=Kordiimonas sp. SCSIO 12603 TaxID=2829596 RepID=UPI0021048582|nr:pentapeptide repeat-containing protein [Kordiimonas sp. SCSIO 12603]UTW58858.1 pentapeptide repeat-containing protein [Kordiimonas sp. SCSIO 12603]
MDLKTLTHMFPSHKLVMGEQFAQENISALKVRAILDWSDTIFVNCDFSEARFHLLMVSGAIFFNCDFSGASFRACDLDACEFISCTLAGTDMKASAVSDTSFTDCIIGGFMGPDDFHCCSFIHPRYSRAAKIDGPMPYVRVTTMGHPLFIYKTAASWHVHSHNGVTNIPLEASPELGADILKALSYAEACIGHGEHMAVKEPS